MKNTNNFNNNYGRENREYTARPAKKKSRVGMWIAAIAMSAAIAVTAGTATFFVMNSHKAPAKPVAVTVQNKAPNAAPVVSKTAETNQKATAAPKTAEVQKTAAAKTADTQKKTASSAAWEIAQKIYDGHNINTTGEKNIVQVDGERVFIDTKHIAPEKTGVPTHYSANGKTSYGFDWTYRADNANFVLTCNYNFAKQQYDFTFYGTQPGTSHVTLLYNTMDNVQVPVFLTLNVDANLNVTQV